MPIAYMAIIPSFGTHFSPPQSPGEVVNHSSLFFYPRDGHKLILAKVLLGLES